MISYKNGNTNVQLLEDGTKIRSWENSVVPRSDFPESIDFKITNFCDMGCSYCHEKSDLKGRAMSKQSFYQVFNLLKDLPAGIELAIGGGNPLSHPDLIWILTQFRNCGFICNLTVHETHVLRYYDKMISLSELGLVKAFGISIRSRQDNSISDKLREAVENIKKNGVQVVFHVIAGIHNTKILETLKDEKVLVLGYKTFGFGEYYMNKFSEDIENSIYKWKIHFPKYLDVIDTLSFDNLAIEQLDVKRIFTDKGWNKFYMGDDGTHSMYIDGVKCEVARTSRSEKRFIIRPNEEEKINYYFNLVRKDK